MLKRLRMLDIFLIRARIPLYLFITFFSWLKFNNNLTYQMSSVLYLYALLLSGWTDFVVRFAPLVLCKS